MVIGETSFSATLVAMNDAPQTTAAKVASKYGSKFDFVIAIIGFANSFNNYPILSFFGR